MLAEGQDRIIDAVAAVGKIAFLSPQGNLAAYCADGKVRFWNVKTGQLLRTVPLAEKARGVVFSGREDLIAVAARGGSVSMWSPKGARSLGATPVAGVRSSPFQFSADATRLATGHSDRTVRLWDVASAKEQLVLRGGIGGTAAIALSPDGGTIVASDDDTNIRVWSTRNGELIRLIDELQLTTFSLAFSPDGKYLASGGADAVLYIWDTATWKIVRRISNQPEMIRSLVFSPDGRLIATGGFNDKSSAEPVSILLNDVATGKVVRRMASPHLVLGAAFSPDGSLLATFTKGSTISLWQVK